MFGLSEESIVTIVAVLAVFGPAFYFIYMVGRLIKYRIDKKYSSSNYGELLELREFRQRTERRLRALEEIVAGQDQETEPAGHEYAETSASVGKSGEQPEPETEKPDGDYEPQEQRKPDKKQGSKAQKGRLPNQLKS